MQKTRVEAYPAMPEYSERLNQTFAVGQKVEIGPRYVTIDLYEDDEANGPAIIVAKHEYLDGASYDVQKLEGGAVYNLVASRIQAL